MHPKTETVNGFISSLSMDCLQEPVLRVHVADVSHPEQGTMVQLTFPEFRALGVTPAVGDKVTVSTFTDGLGMHDPLRTLYISEPTNSGYGASAQIYIWLAALELSLRRKLAESAYLNIQNRETEKWTALLGQLIDWQLDKGFVSSFSRLEPGDLCWYDQLYFAEKTEVGHHAWDRHGETYRLEHAKVENTGIYFPHRGAPKGFYPLLVKR
ncbi:hypothetical protein DTU56_08545 [Salmonella enterica subsp. enterica serovar Muenchen]|uniref:Uncharacterized protein n=1 Tax=Salmonella muenchen TaxID=596 RepID=A0A5U8XJL7_SALMU|nr:hypothetical protein [Salmonella enterica subsp. enterica serovar Muenchen]